MRKCLKLFLGLAAVVSLVMAYSSGPRVTDEAAGGSAYIEVCGRAIVHVPPGTQYVTCRGRVMKVLAIVPLEDGKARTESGDGGGNDCYCPNCCGSACGVVVACGTGLCTMYLYCGD